MKVIMTRQVSVPVLIKDLKENVIVDIENNHVELTLEDNSIFILPSVEAYYSFISQPDLCNINEDIYLDKVFKDSKITLVEYKFRQGVIKTVCESSYNDEPIWLLRF